MYRNGHQVCFCAHRTEVSARNGWYLLSLQPKSSEHKQKLPRKRLTFAMCTASATISSTRASVIVNPDSMYTDQVLEVEQRVGEPKIGGFYGSLTVPKRMFCVPGPCGGVSASNIGLGGHLGEHPLFMLFVMQYLKQQRRWVLHDANRPLSSNSALGRSQLNRRLAMHPSLVKGTSRAIVFYVPFITSLRA